jgi:predicted O-methyltransferase YrrM
MRIVRLERAIDRGIPYFGPELAARQGAPIRHAYMGALIERLQSELGATSLRVLEVGSWAGGSAITWAIAIKKYIGAGSVFCIDHWQPYFSLEVNTERVYRQMDAAARAGTILPLFLHNIRVCGYDDMVVAMRGDARQLLPVLAPMQFDIVFIDASHLYRDVRADLAESADLVRDGGILCGDDLELQADACDLDAARRADGEGRDFVRDGRSGAYFHPGVTLAIWEMFGRVSSWEGFWAMRKTPRGWRKLRLRSAGLVAPAHLVPPFSSLEAEVGEDHAQAYRGPVARDHAESDSGDV